MGRSTENCPPEPWRPLSDVRSAPLCRLVDAGRAFAAQGEHAWAIAQCSDAVQIDPTTRLGKDAAILCAEEGALIGARDHVADLVRIVDSLAAEDPTRAEAVLALERLAALVACDACAHDDGDSRPRLKVVAAAPALHHKNKPKTRAHTQRTR